MGIKQKQIKNKNVLNIELEVSSEGDSSVGINGYSEIVKISIDNPQFDRELYSDLIEGLKDMLTEIYDDATPVKVHVLKAIIDKRRGLK